MASNSELLRKLERAMPVADERIRQQQEAARAIQLQQQVASTPFELPRAQAAQAIGTQQAQVAGQQALASEQSRQDKLTGLTGAAQQQKQQEIQQNIADRGLAAGQRRMDYEEELGNLQRETEDKIFSNQIQFKKDEIGRAEYQQNQLYDLALETAQSEEDFKDRMQMIQQNAEKEILMDKLLAQRLMAIATGEERIQGQQLDQVHKKQLVDMANEAKDRAEREAKRAKNKQAVWTFAGKTVGGVLGAIYGGPEGARIGSAGGGMVGSIAGGQSAKEDAE